MVESKVCNRCGRELGFFDEQQQFYIHTRLGYGSAYDGDVIRYRLCCECIDKSINESAVSPIEEVLSSDS